MHACSVAYTYGEVYVNAIMHGWLLALHVFQAGRFCMTSTTH